MEVTDEKQFFHWQEALNHIQKQFGLWVEIINPYCIQQKDKRRNFKFDIHL